MPDATHLPGITGRVLGVYLGLQAGSLLTTPRAQVTASFAGFEGDRHAGMTRKADGRTPWYRRGLEIRNDRQVSAVSAEELAAVAETLGLPALLPEWLGANLLLEGVPHLTLLPPNSRLVFSGGVVLAVQHENMPCSGPGRQIAEQVGQPGLAARFPKAALHRRGLVACVEKPGLLSAGEAVTVEIYSQQGYFPEGS